MRTSSPDVQSPKSAAVSRETWHRDHKQASGMREDYSVIDVCALKSLQIMVIESQQDLTINAISETDILDPQRIGIS